MSHPQLSEVQSWFLSVLTFPGEVEARLKWAQIRFGLDLGLVADSGRASPRTQLDLYAGGYLLRLLECLRADYPALRELMGEDLFDFFGKMYIWHRPSTSDTLFDLGALFPDFLEETQRQNLAEALTLPVDLARLERARNEAVRAEGLEDQAPGVTIDPLIFLKSSDLSIQTPPCLHLLRLSFPLLDFLQAFDRGERGFPAPDAKSTSVGVSRMRFRVTMAELDSWQMSFLEAANSPMTVFQSARKAAEATSEPFDDILVRLVTWLPSALALGFVKTLNFE